VHFSSIHALSAYPVTEIVNESRPLCNGQKRAPAYDRTKADAERIVLASVARGLDAVIVNPTGIIGPHDHGPSLMGRFLLSLMRGRLPALMGGGFNWVDVRDVCRGALSAGKSGRRGERYLLPGHYLTMRNLAKRIGALTGVRTPGVCLPVTVARALLPFASVSRMVTGKQGALTWASLHALTHHQSVDGSKAQRELGYCPRPIAETLRDTVSWFKEADAI
jgi:dihydroflavonol-4-reductase